MEEHKPCPFCGSVDSFLNDHPPYCYLRMFVDTATGIKTYTRKEIEEAWNDRYEPTCTMTVDYEEPEEAYPVYPIRCSKCGLIHWDAMPSTYCPECGARVLNLE